MRTFLAHQQATINQALGALLPASDCWPERLHQAMRHALLGGGKRVRPILARLAHQAAGGDPDFIIEAACALELIHTYSLVHDDLPAMDDDVLRRGRPTVHVAFDEATAILVGDALLTEGLLLLSQYPRGDHLAGLRCEATRLVAEAVSSRGMVGGQMEDIEAENQPHSSDPRARLERIHRHKTGCLIEASVELGAVLAGALSEEREDFAAFGRALGLAFQIRDDILDATASTEELGKSQGKDEETGKLTYVTLYGLESSRSRLNALEQQLVDLAHRLEKGHGPLGDLALFVTQRTH